MSETHYTDGKIGLQNVYLAVLNISPARVLQYLSDNINHEAVEQWFLDENGSARGSSTFVGPEAGSISMQFPFASQADVRPGFLIHLDRGQGAQYFVLGNPGNAYALNQDVKGSFAVKRLYNPALTNLLSTDEGQGKTLTQAAGALSGDRAAAPTVVNTRAGATLAYSMAAAPGAAAIPGWLTINASTGALSGTAVAGTWDIEIICTDSVTGKVDRVGFGLMHLVITA